MAVKVAKKMEYEVIKELAGEDTIVIVEALRGRQNVSELILTKELNIEINDLRNRLYRLYHANVVNFIKKKDKKKGWYIYYWTYYPEKIKYLALKIKKNRLNGLKERLKREKDNYFFTCKNKCIRLDFDRASEFEFKCPECGELLIQEDNSKIIKQLEDEIKKLEDEIKKIR